MLLHSHIFESYSALDSFLESCHFETTGKVLITMFSGVMDIVVIQQLISYLKEALPESSMIGSTTDGEISNDCVLKQTIVLNFIIFDSSSFSIHVQDLAVSSFITGEALGNIAIENHAKIAILLSDGIYTNGEELIDGFSSVAAQIPIAGGMAGDNGRLSKTYLFANFKIYTKCTIALFLQGESLRYTTKHSFNWMPVGPIFEVTKSIGNHVYTLNNQSVAWVYEKYLGKDAIGKINFSGIEFPLLLHRDGMIIGRSPLLRYDDGSFLFAGNVKEGTKVQLSLGNINDVLKDANVVPSILCDFDPEAIVIFSCTARKRFLGSLTEIELKSFPVLAPTIGFFTYGEFYRDETINKNVFMNDTITLLALSESVNDISSVATKKRALMEGSSQTYTYPFISTFNALTHLLSATSSELNFLNHNLAEQIHVEMASNLENQKMLMAQSRLATMGEMMDMIVHQWRQPLMAMNMISSSLSLKAKMKILDEATLIKDIDVIEEQIQYLSQTIDDFRYLFHVTKTPVSTSLLEISAILQSLLDSSMKNINIDFSVIVAENSQLDIMKNELIQVLLSIINNAKEAIVLNKIKNGVIMVYCGILYGSNKCRITVQDNAGGIPQAYIGKIFEPYFTTKHKQHGSGLGLFIVKTIIEKHLYGTVSIENTTEGAFFSVEFPMKYETKY